MGNLAIDSCSEGSLGKKKPTATQDWSWQSSASLPAGSAALPPCWWERLWAAYDDSGGGSWSWPLPYHLAGCIALAYQHTELSFPPVVCLRRQACMWLVLSSHVWCQAHMGTEVSRMEAATEDNIHCPVPWLKGAWGLGERPARNILGTVFSFGKQSCTSLDSLAVWRERTYTAGRFRLLFHSSR